MSAQYFDEARIGIVIPCYRASRYILGVIAEIDEQVWRIYVVDDCCPEHTGDFVEANCTDERVTVLRHEINQGVGGAVITGYKKAIQDGVDVIVKLDGDGQMDPALIPVFVAPIFAGEADYTKGNRFFDLEEIGAMPKMRLFGNAILSFMTKLSSGYWDLFDPTNGYTAIHADVARHIPYVKISHRYFFETDMLFRLNTLRAVVVDVPMNAKYGDEVSSLKISDIWGEFLVKHFKNFNKRIFYNYYLRDLSLASIELPVGLGLLIFSLFYGLYHWLHSARLSMETPTGIIMLSVTTFLVGLQFVLAFFSHDIAAVPRRSLHPVLRARKR